MHASRGSWLPRYVPAPHTEQDALAVWLDTWPTAHASHLVAASSLDVPAAHAVQAAAPLARAYLPAEHCRQELAPSACAYLPGAHPKQSGWALADEVQPAGHVLQATATSATPRYVPASQLVQPEAPLVLDTWPTAQARQAVAAGPLDWPAWQATHEDIPLTPLD